MKRFCVLISVVFLLGSCSQSRRTVPDGETVTLPWRTGDSTAGVYIDSVEFLPLESHPDGLFGRVNKMMLSGDRIFVMDFIGSNKVIAFDRTSGKFLYKIGTRGRGPKEYIQTRNFTVDDRYVYLIENIKHVVQLYDVRDGRYVTEKKLPFVIYDMAVFGNGDYMFSWAPLQGAERIGSESPHRLFVTDSAMHVKARLFPTGPDDSEIMSFESYFSQSDSLIVFNTPFWDSVAVFDRSDPSLYRMYHIDFGPKRMPLEVKSDPEKMNSYAHLSFQPPLFVSRYMICNYNRPDRGPVSVVYDLETQRAAEPNGYDGLKDMERVLCGEGRMAVALCSPISYRSIQEDLGVDLNLPDSIWTCLEQGDPVLALYYMK